MSSKRQRPSHYTVYRDAFFLSRCSENDALKWLRTRPVEYSSVLGIPRTPPDSHSLEYVLYRRNLPLIDLALAEYARSKSVLERVYRRGCKAVRVTACGNPSLFVGDSILGPQLHEADEPLLWQIVRTGPLPELRAVCENPHITAGFYGSLVSAWEGDEDSKQLSGEPLSSERFKYVLFYLSRNPRVAIPREASRERNYLDGLAHVRYDKFFTKCWELAEIVPVDEEWAQVLSSLYHPLHAPFNVFKDVASVLNRWRQKDEDEFSAIGDVREEIAVKFIKPTAEMLDSDDPAIRRAFYRTFDPEHRSFHDLDWTTWLERDEYCYLDLEQNEKVLRSTHGRSKLEGLLWKRASECHDATEIGFYKERDEQRRKANPESYSDGDN